MSFWEKIDRNDGGFLRLLVVIGFIIFAILGTYFAYSLVLKGANGEFRIVSEWKGWTLYIASLSPGLGFALLVGIVLTFGLPRALKALTPSG